MEKTYITIDDDVYKFVTTMPDGRLLYEKTEPEQPAAESEYGNSILVQPEGPKHVGPMTIKSARYRSSTPRQPKP